VRKMKINPSMLMTKTSEVKCKVTKPRRRSSFVRKIRERVYKKDMDAIIVMAGERGACKSGTSISFGWSIEGDTFRLPDSLLPKGFKLREGEVMPRVVFKPEDFLNLVRDPNLKPGSVIVFDEVGVAGDSREFMSKKNKMLKQVMETIRSKNLIIFLTAPTLKSFDVSLVRSSTFYVRCKGQATKHKGYPCAVIKPYYVETDPKTGQAYFKYLVRRNRVSGVFHQIKKLYVHAPPKHLETPYKRLKEFFQFKLYEAHANKMAEDDTYGLSESREGWTMRDFANEVMKDYRLYYDSGRKRFNSTAIAVGLNLVDAKASKLCGFLNFQVSKGLLKFES